MTQVTFRFPSKVPYAYVEVTGTPEEIAAIDPELLGSLFANAVYSYGKAEYRAGELIASGGSQQAPEKAPEPTQEAAEELIKEELGATEIEAPYKAPAPEPQAKPWQKKAADKAAKVNPDDFGF